jgi:[NiFe] hydrogenase assembly HybE family chaperone
VNNPVARLQAKFEEIATVRMASLPILNPALRVETVGFRVWEGRWLGVLVTPWTINLVLMPTEDAPLEILQLDEQKTWHFPSGAYQFMGLNEADLGVSHICPLISPVFEFSTHEEAVAVANELVEALFVATPTDAIRDAELADEVESARLKGRSVLDRDLSRRDFLRMPFLGR